mmetsp:Transcript_54415/g.117776  ORF Transcript_54415/g.117776 Transcript_54415/m.117776 type:complete len:237 (+) Transcript_54415:1875-2585(+)
MLPKTVKQSRFTHRRHHLILETLFSEAPERLAVLRLGVLEDNLLPGTLVPVALSASRDIYASAENSRAQPETEEWLLIEGRSHLIQVKLTDRVDAARDFDLAGVSEVALEGLHLQRGAHQDHPQILSPCQQVPHEDHVEVCQLVSLVHLIEDDVRDAREIRVLQEAPAEDAQCGKNQASVGSLRLKGSLVTYFSAKGLATLCSNTLCQGHSCNFPRLHHQNLSLRAGVDDDLRHLR